MVDVSTLMQAVYYASLISILSVGVTLSYMTTRVFNFAHVRFAMVGGYLAALFVLWTIVSRKLVAPAKEYYAFFTGQKGVLAPLPWWVYVGALVLSAVIAGIVAVIQYYFVLKPLERRGASSLALMISTLGFDFILVAILFVYATLPFVRDLSLRVKEVAVELEKATHTRYMKYTIDFTSLDMNSLDVRVWIGDLQVPLSALLAPAFAVAVTIGLWLLLKKTKLGVMMRSSIENPSLALVLGINVDRVFAITWFIAGAIAGLAGYLFIFGTQFLVPMTPTSPSDEIIVSVFAGSIVGGINSVTGSIGGGFLIGLIEKLFVPWLSGVTGVDLIKYDKVFSMAAVGLTLLFIPEGLASLFAPERRGRILALIKRPLGRGGGGE